MLSHKSIVVAAVLIGTSLLPISANAAPENLSEEIEVLLDKSYPDDGPGVSVVVTQNGKVIYSGGQGLADLETNTPIKADTIFRIGSITKQFTAATLLQLAQEGKLALDDPLSKFIPDYPAAAAKVTVRHLLNHTSGIQSYTDIAEIMLEDSTAKPRSTQELIAVFKDKQMQFEPGQRFAYNNSGYVLVTAIIEAVTGESWDQVVVDRISGPLNLSSIASFSDEQDVPQMAKGYTVADGGEYALSQKVDASIPSGAGALRGSVLDLASWAIALHGGKILNQASYDMMTAPTIIGEGSSVPYGFGIIISDIRGRKAIGHGGGVFGFSTDSTFLPNDKLFVAVFANSDSPETDPGFLMNRIAALALDDAYPEFTKTKVDPAQLSALFGEYQIAAGDTRLFYMRDGRLYTLRSGRAETEVFAAGQNRFFYGPDSLTWMKIAGKDTGVMVMEMHQNGASEPKIATHIGPVPAKVETAIPRTILERYVGSYSSPIGEFIITWGEGDTLTSKLGPQPAITLSPINDLSFAVAEVGAKIIMTIEDDKVTGLVIEQGGRRLSAERIGDTN